VQLLQPSLQSQQYAFSFPLQIFFNSEILCFFRRIASHWGLALTQPPLDGVWY